MKKIRIEDFNINERSKAIEILEKINRDEKKIYFMTNGREDYFLLEEDSYPLLQSYIGVENIKLLAKKYEEIEKRLSDLEQKLTVKEKTEENKQTTETQTLEKPIIEERVIEQEALAKEKKFEPLKFKLKQEEQEQIVDKYIFKTEPFYCSKCKETVNIDIPYEKDSKGNLKLAKIKEIECPKCHSTIYEKKRRNKLYISLQLITTLIFIYFSYSFIDSITLKNIPLIEMLKSIQFIAMITCIVAFSIIRYIQVKRHGS